MFVAFAGLVKPLYFQLELFPASSVVVVAVVFVLEPLL
jgi:hypothetical protein